MRIRFPAVILVIVVGACTLFSGCSRGLTAVQRQQWNHALTYFLYAQADAQLARHPLLKARQLDDRFARAWVLEGLRQPERIVSEQNIGGHVSFAPGIITLGGDWGRKYIDNPKASTADTMIQLFNDGRSSWDPHERLWHLPHEYHDDYELVRNDDRYHFFLAFYQDPFSATTRD